MKVWSIRIESTEDESQFDEKWVYKSQANKHQLLLDIKAKVHKKVNYESLTN